MDIRSFNKKNPFDFVTNFVLYLYLFIVSPSIIAVKAFGVFINLISGNEV